MHATDVGTLSAQPVVMAQALRKAGFNVNLAAMDWQSVATRRASKAAPAEGGWNIHNTNLYATDVMDPVRSAPAAANGDNAWFGWPDFPQVEELRTKFALPSAPAEQKKIADELQRIGIDEGLYVPLGQMSVPTVYSTKLSGLGEIHAGIRLTPAPRDHPRSGDGRGGGLRDIAFQPGRSGHHHGGRRRHA
ncbi:hypothetical protein G6F31_017439 [Rhizopus arrhizus]|nr:hypothetical protein G6F31_017439 [Rhizopus arrhizus]